MPMEWLPEECKYALTLIDRSRRGDYLSFPHEHWYRRKMNTILHLMKDFPFAIRLVACHAGHGLVRTVPAPRPYLIENFPFHGKTIEVLVISESQKAPQGYVVETIQEEGIPWTYELRCTEKGQYFIQENVRDVTYYWKNDIRGILQKLEQFSKKKKNYLLDSVQCCSLHEFAKNITDGTAYFNGGARKEFSRRFTDQYMIINHLRMEPRFVGRRGILIVDVNRDGTYLIHGHLTYSMLNLARIMRQMITEMEPDMTRYTLIVSNMFENLEFLKDSTPMLGIRQEEYCMELFEPDEAMEIFGKILKEAYQSGRCIVSCARNS
jgi:hypothetical protein